MANLVKGSSYDSVAYGPVQYMNKIDSDASPEGFVYKFITTRSEVKYIKPEELKFFLKREQ